MTNYDAITLALVSGFLTVFSAMWVYRNHDHGFNPNGDERDD